MVATKRCSRCKQEYPKELEYFRRNERYKDGLDCYCKFCRQELGRRNTGSTNPYPKPGIKKCAICKEELPANTDNFADHKRNLDGLDSCCRSCRQEAGKRGGGLKTIERDRIKVAPGMKWCARCKEVFPATLEYFPYRKDSEDSLSGYCRECANEVSRVYAEKHPEKVRNTKKRYEETNREKKRAKEKERRQANPEENHRRRKINALKRLAENPDKEREKQYAAVRRYRQNHPDRVLLLNDRRRLRKIELPSTLTEVEWQNARDYWQCSCVYCGKSEIAGKKLVMDHYIPLVHPECPGTIATNILPACRSCNSKKNSREASSWLVERFGEEYARERLNAIEAYFQWLLNRADNQPD